MPGGPRRHRRASGRMRIIGGAWRGRTLTAPPGLVTRPTSDRLRQALFDMLLHAPWGGRDRLEGAHVLDAFAGTGALGLETLSRGASRATFIETSPVALAALRANIAACRAEKMSEVLAVDVLGQPRGVPADVVFLDPPYGRALVPAALSRLRAGGMVAPGTLIVAETSQEEPSPLADQPGRALAERAHGKGRLTIWREP